MTVWETIPFLITGENDTDTVRAFEKITRARIRARLLLVADVGGLDKAIESLLNANLTTLEGQKLKALESAAADLAKSGALEITLKKAIKALQKELDTIAGGFDGGSERPAPVVKSAVLYELIEPITRGMAKEKAAEILQNAFLPTYKRVKPLYYSMPDNKLFRVLFLTGQLNTEQKEGLLTVRKAGKRSQEINVHAIIDFGGLTANLTPYERVLYNGICSIAESGGRYFTINQLYNTITGTKKKPTAKAAALIEQSIQRLMSIVIKVDISDEIRAARGLTDGQKELTQIGGALLNARWVKFKAPKEINGVITGYELLAAPILLEYANIFKQVIRVNKEITAIEDINGGLITLNERRLAIRDYLLTEIERLRIGRRDNNLIKYSTVFSVCAIQDEHRHIDRYKIFISECLAFWKTKGHIKRYIEKPDGVLLTV